MPRLVRRNLVEASFAAFFLLSVWLVVYKINASSLKYAYYSNSDEEFLRRFQSYANSSRVALSDMSHWLRQYSRTPLQRVVFNNTYQKQSSLLCVGIIHKRRIPIGNYYYPFLTVSSLLSRIKLKHQHSVMIHLINVDDHGPEIDSIKKILHVHELKRAPDDAILVGVKYKESTDYVNILRYFGSLSVCENVLLVEDDTVPCVDWYERIQEALKYITTSNMMRLARTGQNQPEGPGWFCLKLFTSYRWFDWLTDLPTIIFSIMKVIMTSFFIAIVLFKFISWSNLRVYAVVLYSTLLISWLNSNSISPFGYGVKEFSLGFNAVANLYPSAQLNKLADYIEKNSLRNQNLTFIPKDLLMKEFKKESRLDEYLLEPAAFQHLGLQSSMSISRVSFDGIRKKQHAPFQSYSFIKEYDQLISFDPSYWILD